MRKNGFTLLELMAVIAITSALFAIATLSFTSMSRKGNVEGQMKAMFADLMSVRSQALYQKRGRSVVVTASQFSVYSSNVIVTPVSTKALKMPVTPSNLRVDFDHWGGITLNSDDSVPDASVCVQQSSDAAVDSIVISRTRIQVGKLTGTGCSSANIDIK
jgi:prepilin-type N-terminal cleavage/methylation domain-containing protein